MGGQRHKGYERVKSTTKNVSTHDADRLENAGSPAHWRVAAYKAKTPFFMILFSTSEDKDSHVLIHSNPKSKLRAYYNAS